jgi:hypothetical protein
MNDQRVNRRELLQIVGTVAAVTAVSPREATAAEPGGRGVLTPEEMAAVDQALGKKGNWVADQGVYTVPLPRGDLKVRIKDEPVPTPFGFGGWVSFKRTDDGRSTVMMSDVVLLPEEINGVITTAQANGIEISAIHNHFLYEDPRVMFMHVHGMGSPSVLAQAYAQAIRPTKVFPANQPPASPPPARTGKDLFDVPALDQITGHAAAVNGPTIKYTVGRSDLTVRTMGAVITAAIGLNSWAALAGSSEHAHVAGDIAMLEPEVNPVIAALRKHRLEVVALHHHMIGEDPRIIFLHYYGTGSASDLAQGFRAALDELGRHGKSLRMRPMRAGLHG